MPHPRYESKYARPCRGAGTVLVRDNKYVIVLGKEHRKWSFTKGHCEGKETLPQTAMRETLEESGINVIIPDTAIPDFYIIFNNKSNGYTDEATAYFIVRLADHIEPKINDLDEIAEVKWITLDEMVSMPRWKKNSGLCLFATKRHNRRCQSNVHPDSWKKMYISNTPNSNHVPYDSRKYLPPPIRRRRERSKSTGHTERFWCKKAAFRCTSPAPLKPVAHRPKKTESEILNELAVLAESMAIAVIS